MRRTVICVALACWLGCSDSAEDDIRAHVTLAVHQEGREAQQAAEYLTRYGKRALPTIEAAMHTASPAGRKNLILAMRKIADPEAVPLLRHIAEFDPAVDVRREAEWTLRQWAKGPPGTELADKARTAVRSLDEAKGSEESG
jgi:hypothetical protein